jgi:hypothetical protein
MLINEEVAEAFVKEVSETSDGQRLNDTFSDSLTGIEKIKWAEVAAVKLYTKKSYRIINPALRRGELPIGYRNFLTKKG